MPKQLFTSTYPDIWLNQRRTCVMCARERGKQLRSWELAMRPYILRLLCAERTWRKPMLLSKHSYTIWHCISVSLKICQYFNCQPIYALPPHGFSAPWHAPGIVCMHTQTPDGWRSWGGLMNGPHHTIGKRRLEPWFIGILKSVPHMAYTTAE